MQDVKVAFNNSKLQEWIPKTWLKTLQNKIELTIIIEPLKEH